MKCYYDNETCEGPLWECFACGESYCQSHGHNTSEGTNVECVACETERQEIDQVGKEIFHCDWDHEADDVRRCPTHGDAGAWLCHDHYLLLAEEQDVPAWITLPRRDDDDPGLTLAKRAAKALLDLRALYYQAQETNDFSILNIHLSRHEDNEPGIHLDQSDLESISDTAMWNWVVSNLSDGDHCFYAEALLWGVVFTTFIGMFDDDPRAIAEGLGCPQEVLDEFDNANS